jgi:hypothetical protein
MILTRILIPVGALSCTGAISELALMMTGLENWHDSEYLPVAAEHSL